MKFLLKIKVYLQEIFYFLSTAFVVFLLMELLLPGIVLAYLNFNLVLILWLIIGIVIIVIPENKNYEF